MAGSKCFYGTKCYFHHPELNQYPSIPHNFIPHKETPWITSKTRGRSPRRQIPGADYQDDAPPWRRRALDQNSPKERAHRRAPFQHHSSRTRRQRCSDSDNSRGRDRASRSPCRQQRRRRSSSRHRAASSSSDRRHQNRRRRYASARSPSRSQPQRSVNRQHASRGATSHRDSACLLSKELTSPSHRRADITAEQVPAQSPAKQTPTGFPANQLSKYFPLKHSRALASANQRFGSHLPRAGVPSSTLVAPEGTKEGSNGLMQKKSAHGK